MADNLRVSPNGNASGTAHTNRSTPKAPDSENSQASGAGDVAGTSSTTPLLDQLRSAVEATPEIDAQRVADIKQRIANGDYPVDAERIAAKFLDLERSLND